MQKKIIATITDCGPQGENTWALAFTTDSGQRLFRVLRKEHGGDQVALLFGVPFESLDKIVNRRCELVIDEGIKYINPLPPDFRDPAHRTILQAILALVQILPQEERQTIANYLQKVGK